MKKLVLAVCFLLAASAPRCPAWYEDGHRRIVDAAVQAAGNTLPVLFRQGLPAIRSACSDPDLFREPISDELRDAEVPEHYINPELLKGMPLPPTRYGLIDLCAGRRIKPSLVGFLPYAVTEWTERLAVALAEHRARPEEPALEAKCLVYAGILAHYAADLAQPLHVTADFDGRRPGGRGQIRTGIHARVDALAGRLDWPADIQTPGGPPLAFAEVFPAVVGELERSRHLVARVYELEDRLPEPGAKGKVDPAVREFAAERFRSAAVFTAALFRTAWEKSERLKLPDWHQPGP